MPSTVSQLLKSVNLDLKGKVKWGEKVNSNSQGVYIVSLSNNPNENIELLNQAPISIDTICYWLNKVKTFELDKQRCPSSKDVAERISKFWFPDENILYIGMTTSRLKTRISAYYRTELGERKPHAGGHWLKVLSNIQDLYVYYSESNTSPKLLEDKMLEFFVNNVSQSSKNNLFDKVRTFPFANLEYPKGNKKSHGIGKSKLK